jgi:RNA polymerase sigma-70 factor, ECF subfamily
LRVPLWCTQWTDAEGQISLNIPGFLGSAGFWAPAELWALDTAPASKVPVSRIEPGPARLRPCRTGVIVPPDYPYRSLPIGVIVGKMDEVSDTELLRLAREADPAAFRSLIRRHDRYLYRIARSVLLDDEEAEDVVQETFVRAFTHLVDFRGDASLSTWLTRIAFNEALRRRRQRRRIVRLDDLVSAIGCSEKQFDKATMTAPDLDPERATAQHQIRRILERAIDDLPDAFRTVFVMRDIEEASTEETASVLGIRPQTVKTRLHRARRRLRDALGEQIGSALKDAFPFERDRCDRLVERSITQVGLPPLNRSQAGA